MAKEWDRHRASHLAVPAPRPGARSQFHFSRRSEKGTGSRFHLNRRKSARRAETRKIAIARAPSVPVLLLPDFVIATRPGDLVGDSRIEVAGGNSDEVVSYTVPTNPDDLDDVIQEAVADMMIQEPPGQSYVPPISTITFVGSCILLLAALLIRRRST